MNGNCYRCGDQPLKLHLDQTSRVAVPGLTNLLVRQVEYSCANCGEVIHIQQPQIYSESNLPNLPIPTQVDPESVERTRAHIWTFAGSPPRPMDLQYPSILVGGHLYPTFEGSVQDGTSIDKHGEPDLMAEFAEEYLRQFWILIPTGRLPNTLTEVMPPLLLLFTATELVWCIRSSSGIKGRPTPICHPASSKNPFPCPFGKPWNNTTNYGYRTLVDQPL